MSNLYEGMFVLDNDLVRTGWKSAKATVTDLLVKHGGQVRAARRWDERRLAYPINRRGRATYLLTHFDMSSEKVTLLTRDAELSEGILRHLVLRVEEIPAAELELSRAEEADGFTVPEPPVENIPVVEAEPEPRGQADEGGDDSSSSESDSDDGGSDEKEG